MAPMTNVRVRPSPFSRPAILLRGFLALTAALAGLAGGISAQVPDREVPVELLIGLLGRPASVYVGAFPGDIMTDPAFSGLGRVVGGIGRDSSGTVVIAVPGDTAHILSDMAARLESAGWTRRTPFRSAGGGFVPSPMSNVLTQWCSDRWYASLSSLVVDTTPYVRVSFRDRGRTLCDQPVLEVRRRPDIPQLPVLELPWEARVVPAGGGASGDYREARAYVESDSTPAAVADAYARQLSEAGWSEVTGAVGPDVVVRRFEVADDEGNPQVGVLSVSRLSPRRHEATLRVTRVEPPRRDPPPASR